MILDNIPTDIDKLLELTINDLEETLEDCVTQNKALPTTGMQAAGAKVFVEHLKKVQASVDHFMMIHADQEVCRYDAEAFFQAGALWATAGKYEKIFRAIVTGDH